VITFSLRKSPIPATYTLNGTALERRSVTRDLGVLLDSKLTFGPHVDHTIAKANLMLGLVIRSMQLSRCTNRARFDHKAMLCTFYAHVRSVLEYGCVVWAGAAVTHLKRLERVQHKFLMWLAFNSDKPHESIDYKVLLTHFNVTSIRARFAHYDLLFLFNIHRARIDCPDLLAAFGPRFGLCVPRRPTRTLTLWHVPFARVNTVLRSPVTRVPSLCNTFLNCDNSVDIFTSTVYSYKSSVIGFTRTLDAY